MQLCRRDFVASTFAALATAPLLTGRALASGSLESTSLVNGFSAGGTADLMCRWVAPKLVPGFATTAITDNRPGAAGQIAVSYVKGRPADGKSILVTPTSMLTIYPHIYSKLAYDWRQDLTPVSLGSVFQYGLAVGPGVPPEIKTVGDFLAWTRKSDNNANYGSPGAGTTAHFIGTLLGEGAGVKLQHVAYRGGQLAMLDLLGGNVSSVIAPVGTLLQHVSDRKVRVLAVAAAQRSSFAPGVPTFAEQGIAGMEHEEWFGFFLPAKAPQELVQRLNGELRSALKSPDVVRGIGEQGLKATSSSPDELASILNTDMNKWGPIVRKIGFRADS
ncbi:Argininosuccinate lyase [Variovorax sp. PBS-H4]|uniref:tripartite tricarboxylate transporter substrate-binding protein n=1 Tax=Variovorax sp. PBS-H4 TaxID=434008 RepID=UPI0013183165|nr:tripartite tricarboxylate transporter substrate-binding protein [Variovorax sp. PBS-H4]VTU37359.1 Argininosuccinate lyase [Variovorax sp. PBS-H4]